MNGFIMLPGSRRYCTGKLLFLGLFACLLLASCNNSGGKNFGPGAHATKFNGKVTNGLYEDSLFHYKLKVPFHWGLFGRLDLGRMNIPNKYTTFLVGFKFGRDVIGFYDVDLAAYDNDYYALVADYEKGLKGDFLPIAKINSETVKTFDNLKIDNCFQQFRMDLNDKTTNSLNMSVSVIFKRFKTNHVLVAATVISSQARLLAINEAVELICGDPKLK